jgi:hypothetical protein
MTLSSQHLAAIERMVSASVAARGPADPATPRLQELLDAVRKEQAPANDTITPDVTEELVRLGPLVFQIDLPLQVEKARTKPRLLWAKPGVAPKPITGKLATKLFGDAKRARAALRSWVSLPAGARVPFGGGEITADWTPYTIVVCPTLNAYKSMRTFARQNARKLIAERIAAERRRWPDHRWGGAHELVPHGKEQRRSPVGGHRRFVRVTRHSSRRPDELACDVLGGKIPLDGLVEAGILGDDSDAWCEREGRWEAAKTGEGFLRIEVYALTGDAAVPRPVRRRTRGQSGA